MSLFYSIVCLLQSLAILGLGYQIYLLNKFLRNRDRELIENMRRAIRVRGE